MSYNIYYQSNHNLDQQIHHHEDMLVLVLVEAMVEVMEKV